tara:strand:+ start:340774 stop:341070 length:297 start_codon:yes stop_codon:yes gene_type:complete
LYRQLRRVLDRASVGVACIEGGIARRSVRDSRIGWCRVDYGSCIGDNADRGIGSRTWLLATLRSGNALKAISAVDGDLAKVAFTLLTRGSSSKKGQRK